jgi:hypothetical protein
MKNGLYPPIEKKKCIISPVDRVAPRQDQTYFKKEREETSPKKALTAFTKQFTRKAIKPYTQTHSQHISLPFVPSILRSSISDAR